MKSLTTQSIFLIFAQFLNYAFALLSPILLVRVFDVATYGQYREFMLYALLFINFITFSIPSNLQYFISLNPKNYRNIVTNTATMLLLSTMIGIFLIYLFSDLIRSKTSYDFVMYVIFYIIFYLFFNFFENYCIVTKKTNYLPLYSATLVCARVTTAVIIAVVTHDLYKVLFGLIIVELFKAMFLLFFFIKEKSLSHKLDLKLMTQQFSFVTPLGLAGTIIHLSRNLSKLVVSLKLGVGALAIYSIGSYNLPILEIIRKGINDVIFPEMVQRQKIDNKGGLLLWQQANVIIYFIILPFFITLFFYADIFIKLLFTDSYIESVGIFRIYLIFMVRQCFEMGNPIRTKNRNIYFVFGQSLGLISNLAFIYLLLNPLGIKGPAFAFIISDIVVAIFFSLCICKIYHIKVAGLFMWNKIAKISIVSVGLIPILMISYFPFVNQYIGFVVLSIIYFIIYIYICKNINIEEINILLRKILNLKLNLFMKIKRPMER